MTTTNPAIILAEPQMGENIGAVARAMANFGLTDLRLVKPRDGWPNPKAEMMAAGAGELLKGVRVFQSVAEAVADLKFVLATTARERSMAKPVLTPGEGAKRLRALAGAGQQTGLLFGGERAGLTNDDVALADAVVTIPTAPAFSSLNLAQAALLLLYEWFKAGDQTPAERIAFEPGQEPVSREDLIRLFEHLEAELEKSGFLWPPNNRPGMVRSLRSMLHRAGLSDQEVRTLRGVIVALTRGKKRVPAPGEG